MGGGNDTRGKGSPIALHWREREERRRAEKKPEACHARRRRAAGLIDGPVRAARSLFTGVNNIFRRL